MEMGDCRNSVRRAGSDEPNSTLGSQLLKVNQLKMEEEHVNSPGTPMGIARWVIGLAVGCLSFVCTRNGFLISNFSEFQLASAGTFIVHESVFFLSGLPYLLMETWGLQKYKIQRKVNTQAAQEKCLLRLLLYHTCVNLPLMILSYPIFKYMGFTSSLPLPSWKVVSLQIFSYFILEDFIFYWGHRILHTKWLYKHIHSVHHECALAQTCSTSCQMTLIMRLKTLLTILCGRYATPFGLTSEYAHPAEILFLGFATIFGPAITGPHLLTLWLWVSVRVLETVEAHCGYDFPWSLSRFLPIYGGADFHDYHHRLLYTKSGNYSSTFTYMDWIFGTDKGYRKLKALKSLDTAADKSGEKKVE